MSGIVVTASVRKTPLRGKGRWRALVHPIICCLALVQLGSCAHSGDILPLEIRQGRPVLKKTLPESKRIKVAVIPFADQRADPRLVGSRRDWFGGRTSLTVEGGDLGGSIAEVLVEEVKNRCGWHAWVAKPGVHQPEGETDVELHGTIAFFELSAAPGFWGTELAATVRIEINARHAADRRPFSSVAEGIESRWAFWFERSDLESLANLTTRKALERFMAQMVGDDCSFQQKM